MFNGLDPQSNQAINDAIARRQGGAPTPTLDQNTQQPQITAPPTVNSQTPSAMPQGMQTPKAMTQGETKIIVTALKNRLEHLGKMEASGGQQIS